MVAGRFAKRPFENALLEFLSVLRSAPSVQAATTATQEPNQPAIQGVQ